MGGEIRERDRDNGPCFPKPGLVEMLESPVQEEIRDGEPVHKGVGCQDSERE